jgi:uncharacterized delta-60 repeat protein
MSAGDLDPTFGQGGIVNAFGFYGRDLAIQADGKIVTVGILNSDFVVGRLNANGTVDTTFGGGKGFVTTDFGGRSADAADRVAIQPDGKIVAVGRKVFGNITSTIAVARYNTDGTPDLTFGDGGKETVLGDKITHGIADVVVQPNGKIVFATDFRMGGVGGDADFVVFRLNSNGLLDSTFGDERASGRAGYIVHGMGGEDVPHAIALQPDGKIIVGGERGGSHSSFALARYTRSGRLDHNFNIGGKITDDFGGVEAYINAVSVDSTGRIVVAGRIENSMGVVRYGERGYVDSTFGGIDGARYLKVSARDRFDEATAVFARGGKILVAGPVDSSFPRLPGKGFALWRLNDDGTRDATFADGGVKRDGRFTGTSFNAHPVLTPDGSLTLGTTKFPQDTTRLARLIQVMDPPIVQLLSSDDRAAELAGAKNDGVVKVNLGISYDFPMRVYFNLGGNATYGKDYTSTFSLSGKPINAPVTRGLLGGLFSSQAYVDIPAGATGAVLPIKIIDDSSMEPAEAVSISLAANPNYTISGPGSQTITIADNDELHVNFQAPAEGLPPPDRQIDLGLAFGNRGNVLTYGWDADNTANARSRGNTGSPDFRFDSLNHMQKNGADRTWEIAVPNGLYQVRLVADDPSNTDAVYKMSLEGIPALAGTPGDNTRWFMRTVNVQVNDGRLTLSNSAGAVNNRVCFLDIKSAPLDGTAGPVSDNIPIRLGDPAPALKPMRRASLRPLVSDLFSDKTIDQLSM